MATETPNHHCKPNGERNTATESEVAGAANCSLNRVPKRDREMIFHVCQKLNAVLGLNAQEKKWLASLGAEFPKANAEQATHTPRKYHDHD